MDPPDRICVGLILKPFGVRGEVVIRPSTCLPGSFLRLQHVLFLDSSRVTCVYAKLKKNDLILAKFLEYPSRDSVDLLRNVRLYVLRTDFPPTDDDNEFYLFDLIHLKVFSLTKESEPIGEVVNAFDYGAGTFLEVRLIDSGKVATFPFHKKAILSVNLQSSCITVDPEFLISL